MFGVSHKHRSVALALKPPAPIQLLCVRLVRDVLRERGSLLCTFCYAVVHDDMRSPAVQMKSKVGCTAAPSAEAVSIFMYRRLHPNNTMTFKVLLYYFS